MTVTTRVLIQAEVSLRQLFGRRVDIPVELLMPVGFEFAAVSDAQRVTMVVNGQAVSARRLDQQVIDGESFDVYELAASRVVQVEGEMLLPSITVRGERVLSFREDFFEGRVPDKTVVFEAQAPELSLEVVPLPTAPPGSDFRGAMDVRSVVLELLPTESTDADIFMVALSVTLGSIGGSFGDAPLASDFGDFTIVEQRSETVGLTRKHVLQLRRAVSEALSIGPVMVCSFNPRGEGFFELLLTESVAVPGGSSESEAEGAKGWMRVGSLSSEDVSRAPTLEFVMGLLMLPWVLWGVIRLVRFSMDAVKRRRGGNRWRQNRRRLVERLTEKHSLDDFREYLALVLNCEIPAVTSDHLFARLEGVGISQEVAHRSQEFLEALQAGEFSEDPVGPDERRCGVVGAIEREVMGGGLLWMKQACCLFALLSGMALAQATWETQAERAFLRGDIKGAASILHASLPHLTSKEQGVAYFNLALCAESNGNGAAARVAYQRACLRLPDNPSVLSALRRLEVDMGLPQSEGLSESHWLLLMAGLLVESACVGAFLMTRGRRWIVPAAIVAALTVGFCLQEAAAWQQPWAVVVEDGAALRSGPSRQAESLGVVGAGERIRVDQVSDRWIRVQSGGLEVWMQRDQVDLGL